MSAGAANARVAPADRPTTSPEASAPASARWLARAAFLAALAAAVVLLGFALNGGVGLLLVAALAVVVVVASAWCSSPTAARSAGSPWPSWSSRPLVLGLAPGARRAAVGACWSSLVLLGGRGRGRAGRARGGPADAACRSTTRRRPRRPFLIMNPRSGGGKVGRFDLEAKAEALGAEVCCSTGPGTSTSPRWPGDAVARGADLLGVAGGDGTQALVAGVAAEHDVPFLVISAGTRNHFALDLGLDREDPPTCLDALTDGVELRVDLGLHRRTARSSTTPPSAPTRRSCRARPTATTRRARRSTCCPTCSTGQRGAAARSHAPADARVDRPAGRAGQQQPLRDRRPRRAWAAGPGSTPARSAWSPSRVDSAAPGRRAAPRRSRDSGLTMLDARRRSSSTPTPRRSRSASTARPSLLPTPVRCTIRPGALRVRVPAATSRGAATPAATQLGAAAPARVVPPTARVTTMTGARRRRRGPRSRGADDAGPSPGGARRPGPGRVRAPSPPRPPRPSTRRGPDLQRRQLLPAVDGHGRAAGRDRADGGAGRP